MTGHPSPVFLTVTCVRKNSETFEAHDVSPGTLYIVKREETGPRVATGLPPIPPLRFILNRYSPRACAWYAKHDPGPPSRETSYRLGGDGRYYEEGA